MITSTKTSHFYPETQDTPSTQTSQQHTRLNQHSTSHQQRQNWASQPDSPHCPRERTCPAPLRCDAGALHLEFGGAKNGRRWGVLWEREHFWGWVGRLVSFCVWGMWEGEWVSVWVWKRKRVLVWQRPGQREQKVHWKEKKRKEK